MALKYSIHNLGSSKVFEDLVIAICTDLFGIGIKSFSSGKDGGRDSKFTGVAEKYPSTTSPWKDVTIVQAKFTESSEASYSENSFFLKFKREEIPRIKNLKEINDIDNYLLFANRKLTGSQHKIYIDLIKTETGVENVEVIGIEDLNKLINSNPLLIKSFPALGSLIEPLRFFESDLCEVIKFFHVQSKAISIEVEDYSSKVDTNFSYISKEEKNLKNNLSEDYFIYIKELSLPYFNSISNFLSDPKNEEHTESYLNTVAELQSKITAKRDEFDKFESIITHLYDYVFQNNLEEMRKDRRLILTFLHFMYYNCDIGKK